MTLSEFSDVFVALAVQLRAADLDEATVRWYYAALSDQPFELVYAAAVRLARETVWFPKTAEWLAVVRTIAAERQEAQRTRLAAAGPPVCAQCDDTGWARLVDDQGGVRVFRCGCRALREAERLGRAPVPDRLLALDAPDPAVVARVRAALDAADAPAPRRGRMARLAPPADERTDEGAE